MDDICNSAPQRPPRSFLPDMDRSTAVEMLALDREASALVILNSFERHKFNEAQVRSEYRERELQHIQEVGALKSKYELEIHWLKEQVKTLEQLTFKLRKKA